MALTKSDLLLSETSETLESFGFKLSPGGAHISRTMMLEEISLLLAAVPLGSSVDQYRQAVLEENATRKSTVTTRTKTLRHLRELYALSEQIPLFAIYRRLLLFDPSAAPTLSFLVAWTRDPLLRGTSAAIVDVSPGTEISKMQLQRALEESFPNQYSALNIGKVSRNAASSWTQSGHLSGRNKKIRQRVQCQPASATLALLLGHVRGLRGEELLKSMWCRLLDLNSTEVKSLAAQAHREGLLNMRAVGSVVEIDFPSFNQFLEDFQ